MVKISVIISVHNVEKYLDESLQSILNQTLTDIEIICVNDGSTDNSLNILKTYEKQDKRMKVITQKNQGHGAATNKGMTYANGEYLLLMDSDDILEYNALELTYNKAKETNVDFVLFKALNYNNDKRIYYETPSYSMNEIYGRVQDNIFNYNDIKDLIFLVSAAPWSKLYKTQFITDNNIIFPEGLIFDDNIFFWEALFNAKKIVFLNEFLFIRRYHPTSSINNGDLRFLDSIEINKLIWKTFKKYGHFKTHKKELYNTKIISTYTRFTKIKDEYKETFFQEMKKSFMTLLEDEELFEDFIENLNENNKQIFIQVLSTQNRKDFELLRLTDCSMIKTQKKVGEE